MLSTHIAPCFSAVLVLTLGCGKAEPPRAQTSAPEATPTSSLAPARKVETEAFVVEMVPEAAYKAGAEGAVTVAIATKGGYHVNAEYPYKLKLAEPAPEGVTFPKLVLARADGSFEEKTGRFVVPFVPSKAGDVTVRGTLQMSVCSDANCIIEKVPLEVTVAVR